jgi:hypothetical protein
MGMAHEEDRETVTTMSTTVAQADLLKQRNRILALSLAAVSVVTLVVAVTLAVLLHDAGFRHVLAGL